MLDYSANFTFKFHNEEFLVNIGASLYDQHPNSRVSVEFLSTNFHYTRASLRAEGVSECNILDEFDFEKGLRLACTRMLRYMPREFRAKAWAAMNDYIEDSIHNSDISSALHKFWETVRNSPAGIEAAQEANHDLTESKNSLISKY